jgi:hypothetical protein
MVVLVDRRDAPRALFLVGAKEARELGPCVQEVPPPSSLVSWLCFVACLPTVIAEGEHELRGLVRAAREEKAVNAPTQPRDVTSVGSRERKSQHWAHISFGSKNQKRKRKKKTKGRGERG